MDKDIKIVLKAKKDINAFEVLYNKYFPQINNFVYHRVNNEAQSNEIVSNIFYKALKKLSLFKIKRLSGCTFSGWIFRIAVSEINQYFRNEQKERKKINKLKKEKMISNNSNQNNLIDYNLIKNKLNSLSLYEQNIITLRFFEKKKHSEIAKIFGKKENTIKVHVHRALKKLKDLINSDREMNYGESR